MDPNDLCECGHYDEPHSCRSQIAYSWRDITIVSVVGALAFMVLNRVLDGQWHSWLTTILMGVMFFSIGIGNDIVHHYEIRRKHLLVVPILVLAFSFAVLSYGVDTKPPRTCKTTLTTDFKVTTCVTERD